MSAHADRNGEPSECSCACVEWVAKVQDLSDPGLPSFTDLGFWQGQVDQGLDVWTARVRTTRYDCRSLREIAVSRSPSQRLGRAR